MNIFLVVIPFLLQSFTSKCDCENYAPLLEHAKNAQIVLVGEVLSLEEPYFLNADEPLKPGAPNRNSAVNVKVVSLVKGKLNAKEIKIFGYPNYSNDISEEQPFRLGFEYAQKGAKYIFCIEQQEIPAEDIPENAKLKLDYELKCCGASFVTVDEKGYVVGKIENSTAIVSKTLDWVLSQIK